MARFELSERHRSYLLLRRGQFPRWFQRHALAGVAPAVRQGT